MKDLSFFLLKNSLTFKMKKGFKNMCTGDASTSTLNQHHPTLEEMIMQLDLEEKMAPRPSVDVGHRMSCVNSSDILRSARNALNQYPRFSLDGKDAMYRSSFRNFDHGNRPTLGHGHRFLHLPTKVGGEKVIWCKPGVVGKLMGLEAMPIPVRLKHKKNACLARKRNLMARQELERRNHGSCSRASAVAVKKMTATTDGVGWPMGRFM